MLLLCFQKEEFDDDDEWNPCKAAGVCLMLMATCCEDDIVPHVLPFVKEHIKSPDWRYRDAAVMAFGKFLLRGRYRTPCFTLCQRTHQKSRLAIPRCSCHGLW